MLAARGGALAPPLGRRRVGSRFSLGTPKQGFRRAVTPRPEQQTLEEMGAGMGSTFVDELPGDLSNNGAAREVRGAVYSTVRCTPAGGGEPKLVMVSSQVEALLGLAPGELEDNPLAAEYLSGNVMLPGESKAYAQNYGGHQFGEWAGQLGDGRAITLGEVLLPAAAAAAAAEGTRLELQLKGAGTTPFSRRGDGRAVLRSSLREFVASEAMYHLGVPTTRCLSLITTGAGVLRDVYNANAMRMEAGAVVSRVAPSFIRFGTFQLPPARGDAEAAALSAPLVDYVIRHHMTQDLKGNGGECPPALAMLRSTVAATAAMVAGWQAVGFTHGVLNTDNMSILGLTLDYGPFGWMEQFDPQYTPNLSDGGRRYCYIRQPEMAAWNLTQLAEALVRARLLSAKEAEAACGAYNGALRAEYYRRLSDKFGIQCEDDEVGDFCRGFLQRLASSRADFTLSHRALGQCASVAAALGPSASDDELLRPLEETMLGAGAGVLSHGGAFPAGPPLDPALRRSWGAWLREYGARVRAEKRDDSERRAAQDASNPLYVPRNHLLQRAIEAAEDDDFSVARELMDALRMPFVERPGFEAYAAPAPPELAGAPGVAVLS